MRSFRAAPLAALALASLVGACNGSAAGWTFEPPPSVTPVPSVAQSGEPGGSEAPGSPGPGGDGGLEVTAQNITFDPLELSAPADQPFQVHFVNADAAGVPHDIDVRDSGGQTLQDHPTIDGGEETTYDFEALPAGEYTFICSVHPIPNMTGTLTVE